jgi:hypothetical protein
MRRRGRQALDVQQLDLFAQEPETVPEPAQRCTNHYDRAATHLGVVAVDLMHPSNWRFKHPLRCACLGKFPLYLHLVRAGYCAACVDRGVGEWTGPGSVQHFMPIEADVEVNR